MTLVITSRICVSIEYECNVIPQFYHVGAKNNSLYISLFSFLMTEQDYRYNFL